MAWGKLDICALGGVNGLALCADKIIYKMNSEKKRNWFLKMINIVVTFLFISFTWIFFRAETFAEAWLVVKAICTLQDGIVQPYFWSYVAIIILAIGTISAYVKSLIYNLPEIKGFYPILDLKKVGNLTLFFVFIGLIICLGYTGENPFVYFQF